jgi:hypothetical protein
MPRRIEVELTSTRDDGTWTWRAAGAREPKGTLDGGLLFDGAKVGDVVKADADFDVDGIVITGVLAPKAGRKEPERLELLGAPVREEDLVTSTLVEKRGGRRGRRDRDDRDGDSNRRGNRDRKPRSREDRDRGTTGDGERRERRPRSDRRPPRPEPEPKPKPKRLRPGRTHRSAVLASLPEEERPIAEQVVRGGVPAVRQAVEKQNEQAKAEGQPEVKAEPLVAIAERLLPRIKEAEWRDRADAAIANLEELDLRDLRSVVVASDTAARDDETRELASQLRDGLNRRVEEEHAAWLAEIDATLSDGRVVRALRLSSRPPKAGAPLPSELASRLSEAASGSFGPEVTQDRWATVLDAVAYSPVRQTVTPASFPSEPSDELLAAVKKLASRVPEIAAKFGVAPSDAPRRTRGRRGPKPPPPPPPAPPTATAAAAPVDAPAPSTTDDAPTPPVPSEPVEGTPPVVEEPQVVAAQPEQTQAVEEPQPEQTQAVEEPQPEQTQAVEEPQPEQTQAES